MIGAVLGWLIGFGLTSLLASVRFDVGNGMVRNDRLLSGVVGDALLDRRDVLAGRLRRGGLDTGAAGGGGQPGRYHPGCGLTTAVVEARGVEPRAARPGAGDAGGGHRPQHRGGASSSRSPARRARASPRCSTCWACSTGRLPARSFSTAATRREARAAELAALRLSKLGFVFQFHFLLPEFTVLGNVMIPMRKLGGAPEPELRKRAQAAAGRLGPGRSGGASCRRSFPAASASVSPSPARSPTDPRVILADEPTGNLDTKSAQTVFDIFARLAQETGTAVITVTHDEGLAAQTSRRVHSGGRAAGDTKHQMTLKSASFGAMCIVKGGPRHDRRQDREIKERSPLIS